MPRTTSNLPICIHCGTARPADETKCPKCGKPWMDVRVSAPPVAPPPAATAAAPAATVVAAAAMGAPPPADPPPIPITDTDEFGMDDWTLPPEPPKSKAVWLLPIALLAAVAAFWGFVYFGGDATTTTTLAALQTTTTSTTTSTTLAVVESSTTTSSTTTTTTVPYPAADSWQASGSDIPTTELPLKAAGIGPLDFGQPLDDVAGQLIASLGVAEAAGNSDVCEPEEVYWLQWGRLRAVFDGWEPDSSFVSYRYADSDAGTGDVILRTLSGLELGQTVSQLQSTYTSYTVSFEVIDGQDHFRLVDGGELLLWGPVSSTDADGTILGIYSPSPCPAS